MPEKIDSFDSRAKPGETLMPRSLQGNLHAGSCV